MKKKIFLLLSMLLIVFGLLIFYGPSFLTYKDKPLKSDAIVLFLGDENKTRKMEAEKLLREGYARYLITPARGEIQQIMPDGKKRRVSPDLKLGNLLFKLRKKGFYKKYYEDTHIEALEAKRIMDESGFRSAILVSSPYHMRRIRMIADTVFKGGKYNLNCIPTIFEKPFDAGDWRVRSRRGIMVSEYVKIGWFLLYRVFW